MDDLVSIASRFQRDGFALVENFISPDELTTMQRELTRYIDQVVPRVSSRYVFYEAGDNGPIKHLTSLDLHDDFFKQMLARPATLEVVDHPTSTLEDLFLKTVQESRERPGIRFGPQDAPESSEPAESEAADGGAAQEPDSPATDN